MKGKPNVKVFEDEVRDALQFTGDVALALDTLLTALQQGDKLVLKHGDHVSLTTFDVLRAVGREAVLGALEESNKESTEPNVPMGKHHSITSPCPVGP